MKQIRKKQLEIISSSVRRPNASFSFGLMGVVLLTNKTWYMVFESFMVANLPYRPCG